MDSELTLQEWIDKAQAAKVDTAPGSIGIPDELQGGLIDNLVTLSRVIIADRSGSFRGVKVELPGGVI